MSIETSCDETAISIIEAHGGILKPHFRILSNIVLSQAKLHAKYGGVFPSLAKREHAKNLVPVLRQVLRGSDFLKTKGKKQEVKLQKKIENLLAREPELSKQFSEYILTIKKPQIDLIAVTQGPGLEPALWVGINFAKALSLVWEIPLVPVNHMEGHIFSAFITNEEFSIPPVAFPLLALLISGGHTELVLAREWMKYKIVGATRDDAVGEAFDKVARMLGLPYPGGPQIAALAATAQKDAEDDAENRGKEGGEILRKSTRQFDGRATSVKLPRPMINSPDFDFSFSGLKTAVLYTIKKIPHLTGTIKADIAKEFEQSAMDVLLAKTLAAARKYNVKTIVLGGGVTANKKIRKGFRTAAKSITDISLFIPQQQFSTDNAIMIGIAGYFRYTKEGAAKSPSRIKARGTLSL